ncbi:GLEYA domain-containing protein [Hymenobacter sp. 15J16-1T3B]|uniref:GLEYA domain-containing protein n=1 Tax=Hymenobacter sp. 15J16-1T3B TaxID=2886941 RepID=UPI001D10A199|nr:PA14 domain-containing protein [Hymenobacter sp. 15J16-1T3B]
MSLRAQAQADVATNVSGATSAPAGSTVTYTLSVTNNTSGSAATGVIPQLRFTGTVPANVSISNQGTIDGSGVVTFPGRDIGGGGTFQPTVRFTMPASGSVSATASSTSTSTDANAANNNGTAASAGVTTTATQVADVVTSIGGPNVASAGRSVTYQVVVTNYGPSSATGVTAQLTLTGGATGITVSSGSVSGNIVTLTAPGTLASGASAAYTVRFTMPASGNVTGKVTASSTTANGDPAVDNNNGNAPGSNIQTTLVTQTASELCAAPGSDGSITTTANQLLNTYYPGQGSPAAGTSSLSVGSPSGSNVLLRAGDLVLIMQMQGADISTTNSTAYGSGSTSGYGRGTLGTNLSAGQYEYRIVQSISGSTVTLTTPLTYSYQDADATGTAGQRRYQVIRVPQYQALTLGATLTAPYWNGRTGGVLALDVAGTLNLNGNTIDLSRRGFRGGAGRGLTGSNTAGLSASDFLTSATLNTNGSKGEGIAGTPRYVNNNGVLFDTGVEGYPGGSYGRGAPGNAGGGGTDGNPTANDQNTGGGGGANAGIGGFGGNAWDSNLPTGGVGGAPFTQASPSRLVMGGGGGAGTTNNSTGTPGSGFASSGGAGGGIVILRATTVSSSGTINVDGESMGYVPANDGSGGGGAGGSVLILANNSLSNVRITVRGGTGGSNTGSGAPHGPGGGGSAGIIYVSSSAAGGSSELPGNNGATAGNIAYGATAGGISIAATKIDVTPSETTNTPSGANCVADVTTTLIGFTNLAAGQPVTAFEVTFSNNGPNVAQQVTRRVLLPTGATMTAAQQAALPAGATYANGVIDFGTLITLASGASNTYQFTFTAPTAPGTGTISSLVSTSTNQGSDSAPNQATLNVTISTAADVFTTVAAPANATAGSTVSVTATFGNNGPQQATGVTQQLLLQAGVSDVVAPGGTISGTPGGLYTITYLSNGTLPPNTSAQYNVTYTAPGSGSIQALSQINTSSNEGSSTANNSASATTTFAELADVAVAITSAPVALNQNSNSSATVVFTNNGPSTASGITRSVVLTTATLSNVTATNGGTVVRSTGTNRYTITWTSPTTLASGESVTETVNFRTGNPAVEFSIIATIGTTTDENGATANNTTTDIVNDNQRADVTTSFPSGGTTISAGQATGNYTVRYLNNGPDPAVNVTRRVTLPTGATLSAAQEAALPSGASFNNGVIDFGTLASLNAGSSTDLTFSFTAPTTAGTGSLVSNTSMSTRQSTTTNQTDQATLNLTIGAVADAYVTLSGPTTVTAGGTVSLTATFGNNGPSNAAVTTRTVTLPAGVSNVSAPNGTVSGSTAAGYTITYGAATVNSGTSTGFGISYTAPTTGTVAAQGTIATSTNQAGQTSNDTYTLGTSVSEIADVTTTLSGPASGVQGQAVGPYTVTFTNNGPSAASSVTRRVTLPAGATVTAAQLPAGATTSTSGSGSSAVTTVDFGTLTSLLTGAANQSQVQFSFTAPDYASTNATLTSTVGTSTSQGTDVAANQASLTLTLEAAADVVLTITAPTSVQASLNPTSPATFAYQFALTNNGPAFATNVATSVQLARGLRTSGSLPEGAAYNAETGVLTLPTVNTVYANAAAFTYTVNFLVPSSNYAFSAPTNASGTPTVLPLPATGNATSQTTDPTSSNNTNRVANVAVTLPAGSCGGSTFNGTASTQGLYAEYYNTDFSGSNDPNFFTSNTPRFARTESTVSFSDNLRSGYNVWGETGANASTTSPQYLSARYRGYITIQTAGNYVFTLGSDDASFLWVGNRAQDNPLNTSRAQVSNGGAHGVVTINSAPLYLNAGSYPIVILYGQGNGGTELRFEYSGPDTNGSSVLVPASALCSRSFIGAPLPVELTAFTARPQERDALLNWTTAQEKNNARFEVERSLDGHRFEKVAEVAGFGNSTSVRQYSHTDAGAARLGNLVYYRLKQVDFDGTYSYSDVRAVTFKAGVAQAALVPNPSTEATTLDLSALPAGTYHVSLYDVRSRLLQGFEQAGGTTKVLDVHTLPAGVYVVRVRNGAFLTTLRLVKHD